LSSAISLVVLFASAFLLSRAYLTTHAGERILDAVERMTEQRCSGLLFAHLAMTAALSTFLPNVITAMALAPLIPSLVARYAYPDAASRRRITTGFAAATMWGANIGGMGSMVGSPANALLLIYTRATDIPDAERLNFLTWALFGLPLVAFLTGTSFVVLRVALRQDLAAAKPLRSGPETVAAERSLIQRRVFLLTAIFLVFWTCSSGIIMAFPEAELVAAAVSVLFGIWFCYELMIRRPSGELPILPPNEAAGRLPLRGFTLIAIAMAISFSATRVFGFGEMVGRIAALAEAAGFAPPAILISLIACVGLLTEIMSNTVVAVLFFPVVHGVANALAFDPVSTLIAVSLMSTAPFMSPIGSPSNALVLAETRGVDLVFVARLGLIMDLFTAMTLASGAIYLFPRILAI
jgi:sodium-dependent dicarboxylate transporter 2/3/5